LSKAWPLTLCIDQKSMLSSFWIWMIATAVSLASGVPLAIS
jgi:hypothetical protein